MRFSFLAALALVGTALAAPAGPNRSAATIPIGQTCNKDGSMGICESGYCLQDEKAATGTCQAQ
ncbi:uncharacterized protein ACLA_091340 [Aspergillus clavatus NRRL 1]|uniref:Uncharacterized protein n=1 Tax=Aspergillus clavatus (strain ATCC 1007 / CBS 513.65 / DSM 816 / NCTC 3887 / NRRL 1 / QM 1276 / 107) TaxID=344612 RepID=A1CEY7_ASPCL|nr:uncharacterized protein ACLA_091340 [Aspergillus clavatus NRRL 1]EAW11436.1 conserved hypothetical protein [Aspergillus clavatus NRRL 1]